MDGSSNPVTLTDVGLFGGSIGLIDGANSIGTINCDGTSWAFDEGLSKNDHERSS